MSKVKGGGRLGQTQPFYSNLIFIYFGSETRSQCIAQASLKHIMHPPASASCALGLGLQACTTTKNSQLLCY